MGVCFRKSKKKQIIKEVMIARDYDHARQISQSRYPDTTILGVTAIFDKEQG